MKRIVSAVLVVGCLSVGTSGALAATRPATTPLTGSVVCTVGATTVSLRTLTLAGFSPAVASRIMSMLVATASRFPHRGLTCSTPVVIVS